MTSSAPFSRMLEVTITTLDAPNSPATSKFAPGGFDRIHAEKRHLVLIFDEAQEMSSATLNELKLLTNLNAAGKNYLTIILVGQPELRDLVAQLPPSTSASACASISMRSTLRTPAIIFAIASKLRAIPRVNSSPRMRLSLHLSFLPWRPARI